MAAFFRSQDSSGDGVLDSTEITHLLLILRSQAINGETELDAAAAAAAAAVASAEEAEDWVRPTDEEVRAAMASMDGDGDGHVTLLEFCKWWERKGGWEYAEDPGMWGIMTGEESRSESESEAKGEATSRLACLRSGKEHVHGDAGPRQCTLITLQGANHHQPPTRTSN